MGLPTSSIPCHPGELVDACQPLRVRTLVQSARLLGLDVYFPSHDEVAGEQLIPQHDGETELMETLGDEGGGAKFTPGGFRVTVKVAAPVAQGILSHGDSCMANPAAIVTGRGARVNPGMADATRGAWAPLERWHGCREVAL